MTPGVAVAPANIETSTAIEEHCLVFRVSGSASLDQCIELLSEAIRSTRERGFDRMLLDVSRLRAHEQFNLGQRFFAVREWMAAGAGMRIAMVARPEVIDPQKFGVTAARNVGLTTNVFASEAQARAWLLASTDVPRTP